MVERGKMNVKTIARTTAMVGLTVALTAAAVVGFGRSKFTSLPILQGDSIGRQDRPRANFASDAAYIYNLMGARLPGREATAQSGQRTGEQAEKPKEEGGDAGPKPQASAKPQLPDYGMIDAEGANVSDPEKRMEEINQLLDEGNLTSIQIIRLKQLYKELYNNENAGPAQAADSASAPVPEPVAVPDTSQEEQPAKPVEQVASQAGYGTVMVEGNRVLGADSVDLQEIARVMTSIMELLKNAQLDGVQIVELKDIYRKLYEKGKNE